MTNVVPQVGEQACLIFTWGRGREGQLGNGAHADSAFPQPVGDLQGRQVLQVFKESSLRIQVQCTTCFDKARHVGNSGGATEPSR